MSFRLRLIVVSALAVAIAIAVVSGTVYFLVSEQLNNQFNRSLQDRAAQATSLAPSLSYRTPEHCAVNLTEPIARDLGSYFQTNTTTGGVVKAYGLAGGVLPVTNRERSMAVPGHKNDAFTHDITIKIPSSAGVIKQRVRVYTSHFKPDCAIQVARPLTSVTQPLQKVLVATLVVSLGGIGLAIVLGWVIAGMALRPVRHMTEASEHVARTRDLSRRIEMRGRDELARLARSFNTMLEALELSLRSQRQLVADASHELRTPLTTAKTNVEVLRRAELPKEEQEVILRDVSQQIDELALIVDNVVDLARGVEPNLEVEEVRLDLLAEQAVGRARRLSPGSKFTLDLEPCLVRGVPSRLERAIANLLDNACKWSPAEAPIEVKVSRGTVSVRDHGQGIDDADLPQVFDRFYRAPSARSLPGSGLGLAIVRQVAESYGGRVSVERPSDGGAMLRIELPCLDED